jgi:hypothetical protein
MCAHLHTFYIICWCGAMLWRNRQITLYTVLVRDDSACAITATLTHKNSHAIHVPFAHFISNNTRRESRSSIPQLMQFTSPKWNFIEHKFCWNPSPKNGLIQLIKLAAVNYLVLLVPHWGAAILLLNKIRRRGTILPLQSIICYYTFSLLF